MSQQVDTVIRNGTLVTADGMRAAGLAVDGGKVVAVGADENLPEAREVIDAEGNYILPGLLEPHMHLQDAYYKYEQLIESETKVAAGSGVTTIIPMLFRRADPTESFHTVFPYLKEGAERGAHVDYSFTGLVTADDQIDELPDYARNYGMTSFKVMMAYTGAEAEVFGVRSVDDSQIIRTLEQMRDVGYPGLTMIHTENMDIVYHHKAKMIAENRQDLGAYDDARPYYAEEENLRRAIYFAEITQAPLYVVHMSIGTGVDLVRDAKARGVKIIAETCPHYLQFTRDDENKVGRIGKVNPPIRSKWHQERLWGGIQEGIISCVGSDHSTIMPVEDKIKNDLWSALPGFPGTGEILPVMLNQGVHAGRISLSKLVEICSTNVAKIFGVYPQKGTLQVGSDADVTILDINRKHTISAETHHSLAGYNLYEGIESRGWPVLTMVRGTVVMRNDEIRGKPGYGQYLHRELGKETWDDFGFFAPGGTATVQRKLPSALPV
jgi:D-hydantoinase